MNTHEWLKKRGYQGPVIDRFKEHAVYFHRKIPETNHQWIVWEHRIDTRYHGFEVEMVYETRGHVWVKSSFYGLSEQELRKNLPVLEKRIYAAVASMGGNPKDYQCEK